MYQKILVPLDIDYTETAAAVYRKAAELAGCSGGEIRLLSVLPGFGMPIVASYVTDDIRRETYESVCAALEDFIQKYCTPEVSYQVATGKNWEEIIKTAQNWGADLIVVYHNYRREFNEAFSGSCARRDAEHADCSVLWVRNVHP
mgnify:CR=1 FL=1